MCGITLFMINNNSNNNRINYNEELLNSSKLIRHRGPDWSGKNIINSTYHTIYMGHERLSIIDPKGSQPIIYNFTVMVKNIV